MGMVCSALEIRTVPVFLTYSRDVVAEKLQMQMETGSGLLNSVRMEGSVTDEDLAGSIKKWMDRTGHLLLNSFSDESIAGGFLRAHAVTNGRDTTRTYWTKELPAKLMALDSVINRLDLFEEDADLGMSTQQGNVSGRGTTDVPNRGTVFVVHGRDSRLEAVARFLEHECPEVTILSEEANEGLTLIEKFEKHAGRALYSVVLFTGDDEGRLVGESELKRRPRQNVVLELGFFLAAIGRDRVAVLYEEGVEQPSDFSGVSYIPFDSHDGWKENLRRELRAAGFPLVEH